MAPSPQYQHYVPQTILRKFTSFVKPLETAYATKKDWERAVKMAKQKARINLLQFDDNFDNERLESKATTKAFGILDMYDSDIEKRLGTLEQQNSKVLEKVEQDFLAQKTSTTITRPEKDILRKFIFIMMFRNQTFYERFRTTKEEYNGNDKDQLHDYMRQNGLTTPKAVWLRTLSAFLDVDLGQDIKTWTGWLFKNVYPHDAQWFVNHMTKSYLSFCSPSEADDQFILTQNAYDVLEGSCSHIAGAHWHTFAPINEKLIIVLRNTWHGGSSTVLPKAKDALPAALPAGVVSQTENNDVHPATGSCLGDLPIALPIQGTQILITVGDDSAGRQNVVDDFTFSFYYLSHKHAQLINSIFLEQAYQINTLAYKSPIGLRRAVEAYLLLDDPNFKQNANLSATLTGARFIYYDHHGPRLELEPGLFRRRPYLNMLQRVVAQLGSATVDQTSPINPKVELTMPHFPQSVLDRYNKLGFNNLVPTWLHDLEQACCISKLRYYAHNVSLRQSQPLQGKIQQNLMNLLSELPPQRVWLHLRVMRVAPLHPQKFGNNDDTLRYLVAEENGGLEDKVVDAMKLFHPHAVSRALLRASKIHDFTLEDTNPRSGAEFFITALFICGKIENCGIYWLERAAVAIERETQCNAEIMGKITTTAAKLSCAVELVLEQWIRVQIWQRYKRIMEGVNLEDRESIESLKALLFEMMYPNALWRYSAQ